MKKILLLTAAAVALFSENAYAGNVSSAQNKTYVSLKAAQSKYKAEFDGGDSVKDDVTGARLALGFARGVDNGTLRAEIELGMDGKAKESAKEGDGYSYFESEYSFEKASLMANVYFDFDTKTAFSPYISVGAGVARVKGSLYEYGEDNSYFEEFSGSKTQYNFAYQLTAGVGYKINDKMTLDVSYRYADFGESKISGSGAGFDAMGAYTLEDEVKADLTSSEIMIGLRYTF